MLFLFPLNFVTNRRAVLLDLYTADQVHLLPGYPTNSSGAIMVAFYVQQPLGLFTGNVSVLPRGTLVDIVMTHKSELEAATGATILSVEALFKPFSPTLTTSMVSTPSEKASSDSWKWIAVGVGAGVGSVILILFLIWW